MRTNYLRHLANMLGGGSSQLNDNDNDNDNEIHLFKPNFIYTIDNKYCL